MQPWQHSNYGAPAGLGDFQDRLGQVGLAIFFKNRHGFIYKTSIFCENGMEVLSIQENYFKLTCSQIFDN